MRWKNSKLLVTVWSLLWAVLQSNAATVQAKALVQSVGEARAPIGQSLTAAKRADTDEQFPVIPLLWKSPTSKLLARKIVDTNLHNTVCKLLRSWNRFDYISHGIKENEFSLLLLMCNLGHDDTVWILSILYEDLKAKEEVNEYSAENED